MYEPEDLKKIATMKIPFGRFKGKLLIDLPEAYLLWFQKEGFPNGELGMLMALTLEIKINCLESLIQPLRKSR